MFVQLVVELHHDCNKYHFVLFIPDFQTYYLIKWKNYSTNENTWEPIGNLSCEEIIEEYEANQCCSVESALEPKQIKNKRTKGGKVSVILISFFFKSLANRKVVISG